MIHVANLSETDRRALFLNTAEKKNLHPAVVEKDFWVCYLLDHLFHRNQYQKSFVFKGGTSLSMAYHLIERFSEDIDLILDWRTIQFQTDEIWSPRSNTKQDQFNKAMNQAAVTFIGGDLKSSLIQSMRSELSFVPDLSVDAEDSQVLNFYYPHIFQEDYIRPEIRLEIGPVAEWTPSHQVEICSMAAREYTRIFESPSTMVLTVDVERTFWEKATILHKIAHFPESKKLPPRYARHYYDLYMMYHSSVKDDAFKRKELLLKDIAFKSKFYYSKSASYETATLSGIKLAPPERLISEISMDYDRMKNMIYGEKPDFETILRDVSLLEDEIHNLVESDI